MKPITKEYAGMTMTLRKDGACGLTIERRIYVESEKTWEPAGSVHLPWGAVHDLIDILKEEWP